MRPECTKSRALRACCLKLAEWFTMKTFPWHFICSAAAYKSRASRALVVMGFSMKMWKLAFAAKSPKLLCVLWVEEIITPSVLSARLESRTLQRCGKEVLGTLLPARPVASYPNCTCSMSLWFVGPQWPPTPPGDFSAIVANASPVPKNRHHTVRCGPCPAPLAFSSHLVPCGSCLSERLDFLAFFLSQWVTEVNGTHSLIALEDELWIPR